MPCDVSVVPCPDYDETRVTEALLAALAPLGGLDWVNPGMRIAIKTNLVGPLKPDTAAVTHPVVVTALCRLLTQRGAEVIVGDSPGGPWAAAWVSSTYNACGIRAVENAGATLNRDFSQRDVSFPEAVACRHFPYTTWLESADAVIDCCKLKTHGLTGMSCAAKNLFGVIPGTRKPEFHFLYPDVTVFSNMLVDLTEYVKPRLSVVDAVTCMEGNGPTQGTPRHMGALVCAHSPHHADLVCAGLIGFEPQEVATLAAAIERGLCPASADALEVFGNPAAFALPDFEKLPHRDTAIFGLRLLFIDKLMARGFGARPHVVRDACIACGRCVEVCPKDTVFLRGGRAVIERKPCIRCFCCQEFCPKGAIVIRRPILARLLGK